MYFLTKIINLKKNTVTKLTVLKSYCVTSIHDRSAEWVISILRLDNLKNVQLLPKKANWPAVNC